jgi:outer membrane autotransporter protein
VVSGGELQSDLLSLSVYTTWYAERFHVDGIVTFGSADYEMDRRVELPFPGSFTVRGDTDGTQLEATVAGGYTGHRGAFQYSPYLRLDWLQVDVDGYVETGAPGLDLVMEDQSIDSFASTLGGRLSWTHSGEKSVVIPQFRFDWSHEFDDDSRPLTARFASDPSSAFFSVPTDDADPDYFTAGAGVAWVLQGGRQVFVDVESLIGLRDVTNHAVTAGIRFTL